MNFSHGSYEYHQSVIDNTRKMIAGTTFKLVSQVVGQKGLTRTDCFFAQLTPKDVPLPLHSIRFVPFT